MNFTKEQIKNLKSPPHLNEIVPAYVVDVYDGDTCTVIYNINQEPFMINVRLAGIDTPEKHAKNDLEKKASSLIEDYVKKLILNKTVNLEIIGWDKYGGRIVGYIYCDEIDNENKCLNTLLLNENLAKSFTGKTKKDIWINEELGNIIDYFNNSK
ncbi:SNase-like protein [Hokovirus HKV1]|uniref:SNase-like protein n=1 Tax=Hokovirus HKV1 TaxID=1977638 RepID=A0A1V0SF16_9VIRU|nr:SNase-like protein [Hokovirus HKV1]